MGSGTTLLTANRMNRNSIGIDISEEYYKMVKKQIE
jgi:DNA modification methylase